MTEFYHQRRQDRNIYINNVFYRKMVRVIAVSILLSLSVGMAYAGEIDTSAETTSSGQFDNHSCSTSPAAGVTLYGYVSVDSSKAGALNHTYVMWKARQYGENCGAYQNASYSFGTGSSYDDIVSETDMNPLRAPSVTYSEDKSYWFTSSKKANVKINY